MNKQDEALEFVVKTLKHYGRGLMTMRESGYDIMLKGDELDNELYERGLMTMREAGYDILFKGNESDNELLSHLGHVILLGNLAVQGVYNVQ